MYIEVHMYSVVIIINNNEHLGNQKICLKFYLNLIYLMKYFPY